VLFCLFRRDLPDVQALLAVILWAGWPFVLWFKDSVLPDFLFTLLWCIALWLIRVSYEQSPDRGKVIRGILIGLISYAAYATRSVGVVLPAALVSYDLLRSRRLGPIAGYGAAVFMVLAACQNLVIHSETSYLQMFTLALGRTSLIYLHSLSSIFSTATNGWVRVVRYAATCAAILLFCKGFYWTLRRFRSPIEIAVGMYLVLLLLWSSGSGTRYVIPVMPFFLFYVVTALETIVRTVNLRTGFALESALMVSLLICYAAEDSNFRNTYVPGGVSTEGFAELCRYIVTETKTSDVFVFQNPRVLSLYTRRPSSVYPEHGSPELIWSYSERIHAHYMIVTDFLEGDAETLEPFVRKYGAHLRTVFTNPNFRLYALVY